MENWGHDELKKKYIDDEQVIVEGGLTGNKGVIGWYVPPWMVDKYPDITDCREPQEVPDAVPDRSPRARASSSPATRPS